MRVLHLNFHRGWGGQPARILMGSIELARRGHDVALALPGDGILAARAREAGLTTFGDFKFYKPRRLISAARDVRILRKVLGSYRPDLLHSHGSQDTWTTVFANRFGGPHLPHLLTRHNSKRVPFNAANRYLYGVALDRLVVVSAGVLERYERFVRRGILDPERIPIIPSTIDFGRYDAALDPGRVRRELRLPPDAPLVGSIGRLVRDKGQHVLIEAFRKVAAARSDARLALVGTGTEEENLRRLAARLELQDRVMFLGFRTDVPDITAALDVAVLASVDCDASPAVVKEAMYLRKAVVVTDIGGLREMVEDGRTGRVVPPGEPEPLADAVISLLADQRFARTLGERARETVRQRYTLDAMVDAYERVYGSLLPEIRPRA